MESDCPRVLRQALAVGLATDVAVAQVGQLALLPAAVAVFTNVDDGPVASLTTDSSWSRSSSSHFVERKTKVVVRHPGSLGWRSGAAERTQAIASGSAVKMAKDFNAAAEGPLR